MIKKAKKLHAILLLSSLLTGSVAYGMDQECDCWDNIKIKNLGPSRVEQKSPECRFVYYDNRGLIDSDLSELSNKERLPNPIKGLNFDDNNLTHIAIPHFVKIISKLPDLKTFHAKGKTQAFKLDDVENLAREVAGRDNRNGKLSISLYTTDHGLVDYEVENENYKQTHKEY